jgi:hypothetical protein
MARSTAARPKARDFDPAQARHGSFLTVPGPARPIYRALAWAATLARRAARARPDFQNWAVNNQLT